MSGLTGKVRKLTPEHLMLLTFIVLGIVFFIEPIVRDYPSDARVFPQLMGSVVVIGSALLLARNYLPGPLQTFVAESVSLTQDLEDDDVEIEDDDVEIEDDGKSEVVEKDQPLHVAWGYEFNNTIIMIVFSTVYFFLGWAAGFLYVTPFFVFGYTYWFRVKWWKGALLAVLATVIVYGFIVFLLMPFDEGQLILQRGLI